MHHDKHRCANCGHRYGLHQGSTDRCPATDKEPRWPSTIKDEARAGALYDKRLEAYFAKRGTKFRPV